MKKLLYKWRLLRQLLKAESYCLITCSLRDTTFEGDMLLPELQRAKVVIEQAIKERNDQLQRPQSPQSSKG